MSRLLLSFSSSKAHISVWAVFPGNHFDVPKLICCSSPWQSFSADREHKTQGSVPSSSAPTAMTALRHMHHGQHQGSVYGWEPLDLDIHIPGKEQHGSSQPKQYLLVTLVCIDVSDLCMQQVCCCRAAAHPPHDR